MRKDIIVDLGDKQVKIKELQVEPVLKVLEDILEGRISLGNQIKILWELMKDCISIPPEEYRKLYFSEITLIENGFREINKDFFRYLDLTISAGTWIYKNTNLSELLKLILKDVFSGMIKEYEKKDSSSSQAA